MARGRAVVNPEAMRLLMENDELVELDPAERRLALRALLNPVDADGPSLAVRVADLIDGYGPLTALMRDPEVTDVLVNGPSEVWAERAGTLERTGVSFDDETELRSLIARLMTSAGGRVDMARPIADARLPDGSRLHVVLPPLAPDGPLVSLRRFPAAAFTLEDLERKGMFTPSQRCQLESVVAKRRTVVISGGTGTGKTTLLNALLGLVPGSERVVLIEETRELRPGCPHAISLVARVPNVEDRGAIGLADLLRASLRMRPDRIIVGEVRGGEALVALDAMSTGHQGSMVTVHARSSSQVVDRLVGLAMNVGGRSEPDLRERFATAFDVAVHLERRGARRIVSEIAEL